MINENSASGDFISLCNRNNLMVAEVGLLPNKVKILTLMGANVLIFPKEESVFDSQDARWWQVALNVCKDSSEACAEAVIATAEKRGKTSFALYKIVFLAD